jgi:aspartyl-tRNA(Asn)/glutamyl-tRNA(Gln) amidotransferase subunit A
MLEAMAGQHTSDPFSYGAPSRGFVAAAHPHGSLGALRVAWRPRMANTVVDSEVLALCERALKTLAGLGADVAEMGDDLEPVEPIWLAYSAAMWSARFQDALPAWREKISPTLLRQMALADGISGADVGRALLRRTALFRQVQAWFERCDIMVTPTLTRTAIDLQERLFAPIEIEGRPVDTVRKAWYPYTHPFNLTGHPAISLPAGFARDGLPVAVQLIGRKGEDARLLRVAALFEEAQPWTGRWPKL